MKILAITKREEGATYDEIQKYQRSEAAAVWQGISDGFIREIYFDAKKPAVVLIVESDSVEAASDRLRTLPMVEAGLLWFDFIELGPYVQLEYLFGR